MLLGCFSAYAFTQADTEWKNQGVLHTASSPNVKLHSIPIHAVRLGAGFWKDRMEVNRRKSIPSMYKLLEENGVVDNFRRLSGRKDVPRRGPLYTDSDLFKWMEAASWSLAGEKDQELSDLLEKLTEEIGAAQGKDGYLNSYYALERADERFTNFQHGHELYCLGHLLQAGIANLRATGNPELFQIGKRYADYVIATLGTGKKAAFTGHPELEMALIELYRTTKEPNYLSFADYLLNQEKPEIKLSPRDIAYSFSFIPITRRTALEGHSVRATYALCGAADYYAETRQEPFHIMLETIWTDMIRHKMYITAGLGSRESGEAIGDTYELPNERAYTETCAAIGNYMWNWRMLQITGEARFAEIWERALYNGILSGISISGDLYFYRNPLASSGRMERKPWYATTCCPPNIQRTLASLPGYMFSTSPDGLWIHLYHSAELNWHLENGLPLRLSMETRYPWDGKIDIVFHPEKTFSFPLHLRIPGWCTSARYRLNGGKEQSITIPSPGLGSYFTISREWHPSDRLEIFLDMTIQPVQSNPHVAENTDRIAITRGPLVYCYEAKGVDHPSPFDIRLQTGVVSHRLYKIVWDPNLLGGMILIQAPAKVMQPSYSELPLYYSPGNGPKPKTALGSQIVTLLPYYAWANRGASEMQVWLPRD